MRLAAVLDADAPHSLSNGRSIKAAHLHFNL
jgi:hypothetical protein